MKSKQTNYQNALSTKKMKQAAKALLVATVMASQVVTVLPTNIFAAEANSVATAPAGATEVATLADFKAALLSTTVTDIKLTADIKLTGRINVATQKNLYGNGHTIDMNNFDIQLLKADSVNRVEDLTIINQNVYTLFWSVAANVEVTFKNVSSSGQQCMYNANGTTIIEGKYTGSSTLGEIFQGKNLLIKEGASMDASTVGAPGYSAFFMDGNLTQEKNSNVKLASRYITIWATSTSAQISIAGNMELSSQNQQAVYAEGGDMLVKTGAKFKATGGSTAEEGISITNGNLTVQSGADFTAISKGTQGTVQTGGKLVFENGSNFAITNTNSTGSVFANYARTSTNININSDRGLSTWDSGLTNSAEPTRSYNDFTTATLDLSGWDKGNLSQKNLTSNSAQFQSQFVSKTTAKLFGGSYSETYIAKTTIEELTTDSIKATGMAEPNATIVIKNDAGVTLATGKVGSDGYYSVTIPKQVAGTKLTATAANSSTTTIVKQATITQTTIAPLTTDSTKITGKAEPNADIEITANGSVIGSGKVGLDGNYSITILQQDVGTRVTATATLGGATSSATETVTQGDLVQTAIAALTTKSTLATGKAEPNANIEITVNDSIIGSGKVGSDGNYSITIPKQAEGTVVNATAKSAGKISIAQTTVVRGEINQTTINKVTTESTSVSGTAEANSTLVVKDSEGKELATGRVGSDGVYSLMIPKQAEGKILMITTSLGGFTSTASTIVVRDGINQTTINSLTTDSTSVSGIAEPNATIVIKNQDGIQLATGRAGSDGIYSLTIAKQVANTVVTATATQDDKTSSASTTVTQEAAEASVKDLFNNGDVTGTIKDTTDQAAIDKAQKVVDAVTDPTKKATLQKNLDEAKRQLDEKQAAAEKARQEAAEKSV
ncbi:Ig-like domain-containing protein, partial [Paenilisteria newyorkensis]|uniref:Ig-like domain-containing protein n=1 Tax=Listeria newyorkensis TaxID=1497681 RepID=UPI0021B21611